MNGAAVLFKRCGGVVRPLVVNGLCLLAAMGFGSWSVGFLEAVEGGLEQGFFVLPVVFCFDGGTSVFTEARGFFGVAEEFENSLRDGVWVGDVDEEAALGFLGDMTDFDSEIGRDEGDAFAHVVEHFMRHGVDVRGDAGLEKNEAEA